MPIIPNSNHSRMFNYKSMRLERQNKYKFRDASMEPPKVKVGQVKPIAAGNIVHKFSLPSHLASGDQNSHLVLSTRQERGTDHVQMQSKVSLHRQPKEFVAYFNERDGRGFLKDSQDSAMQQMVIKFDFIYLSFLGCTEKSLT